MSYTGTDISRCFNMKGKFRFVIGICILALIFGSLSGSALLDGSAMSIGSHEVDDAYIIPLENANEDTDDEEFPENVWRVVLISSMIFTLLFIFGLIYHKKWGTPPPMHEGVVRDREKK